MPMPGMLGGLTDPTARPDEPITAGLPFGPGAGPEPEYGAPNPLEVLWAIYQQYPNPDLARLLGR